MWCVCVCVGEVRFVCVCVCVCVGGRIVRVLLIINETDRCLHVHVQ